MLNARQAFGRQGENEAVKFLQKHGYEMLECNYRSVYGEIDIVAKEKKDIVFIEVKTRKGLSYGPAELAVNRKKQQKIVRTALQYLKHHKIENSFFRFDVVTLTEGNLELIKEAFVPERGRYY